MADNIVINLEVNAAGAVQNIDAVEAAIVETSEATQSLKAQLRALQLEMQTLDPNSARFDELSRKAGELKDTINDTAEAVKANAGNAFEALGSNAANLTSRLMSLDFEGVGQSATAMAGNLKRVNFADIVGGIKSMGASLKALGLSLLSNPIFLIVAAIAAIGLALKAGLDQQREAVDNANKLIDASNERRHREEKKRIASAQGDEAKLAQIKQEIAQKDIQDTEAKIRNLQAQQRTFYGISEEQEKTLDDLRKQLADQRVDYEVQAINQMNALNAARVELQTRYENIGLTSRQLTEKEMDASYKRETESLLAKGATEEELYKLDAIYEDKKNTLHRQYEAEDAAKRKQAADARKAQREKEAQEEEQRIKDEAEKKRDQLNSIEKLTTSRDATMLKNEFDTGLKMIDMQARTQAAITENLKLEEQKRQKIRENNMQFTKDNLVNGLEFLANVTTIFEGKSRKEQEKAFKIRKSISIAQTLISTYQGAMQAYNSQIVPLDPSSVVRGAIAAAFVVATGLANVKKIASQKFDGGGATGGGSPGGAPSLGGGGSMAGGTPTFNPVDMSFINNRPAQGAQTYVLAGSVSNAQDANAKIQDLRRL
jgi:uncharacterized coiled-coil protein SlyX